MFHMFVVVISAGKPIRHTFGLGTGVGIGVAVGLGVGVAVGVAVITTMTDVGVDAGVGVAVGLGVGVGAAVGTGVGAGLSQLTEIRSTKEAKNARYPIIRLLMTRLLIQPGLKRI